MREILWLFQLNHPSLIYIEFICIMFFWLGVFARLI